MWRDSEEAAEMAEELEMARGMGIDTRGAMRGRGGVPIIGRIASGNLNAKENEG